MLAQDGSLLKSLFTCYFGADMTEDESNHPSNRGGSPEGSVRGGGSSGRAAASSALSMSDRTVVHTLGDTVRCLPRICGMNQPISGP